MCLTAFCAQERLGVLLEKEDEMDCAVAGCNFLLKAVSQEAFTYEDGQANFSNGGTQHSHNLSGLLVPGSVRLLDICRNNHQI